MSYGLAAFLSYAFVALGACGGSVQAPANSDASGDAGADETAVIDSGCCADADATATEASLADSGVTVDSGQAFDTGQSIQDTGTARDALAACNALDTGKPDVHVMAATGSAPTLTGGTLSSGTYRLVEATLYGGGSGPTGLVVAWTLNVTVATDGSVDLEWGRRDSDQDVLQQVSVQGARPVGNKWAWVFSCGPASGQSLAEYYQASGTDLYLNAVGADGVFHYQKQ